MQQQQEQFTSLDGMDRIRMLAELPRQSESSRLSLSQSSRGAVATPVAPTITPASTPPIRVSESGREDAMTAEAQRRYYENSTWRMFDRIHTSRVPVAPKQFLIPPPNSLTSILAERGGRSYYTQRQEYRPDDKAVDVPRDEVPGDEELIFDLDDL